MDRIAETARLVGGFTFTGTSRHFVQYRDAGAPFGYDAGQLLATDAALALYHDALHADLRRRASRSSSARSSCGSMPHVDPAPPTSPARASSSPSRARPGAHPLPRPLARRRRGHGRPSGPRRARSTTGPVRALRPPRPGLCPQRMRRAPATHARASRPSSPSGPASRSRSGSATRSSSARARSSIRTGSCSCAVGGTSPGRSSGSRRWAISAPSRASSCAARTREGSRSPARPPSRS